MKVSDADKLNGRWNWPTVLGNTPGLVGDVAKWILDSSVMPQPKFALAGALTVCGALLGCGVKDWCGQRSNLYTLAIGNTSAGKNCPLVCIDKLVRAMGRELLLCGEVTSDTALEVMLLTFRSRLMVIDEVGHYLGSIKSAGTSNGHLRTVMPMLTKAWSAAGGALLGKSRAPDTNGNPRPTRIIHEPCVTFYGTTAPDVLFDSMSNGDFQDGSIPRFIPFISLDRPTAEMKKEASVPVRILDDLSDALDALGLVRGIYEKSADGSRLVFGEPVLFDRDDSAELVFAALEDEKHENLLKADAGEASLYLWGKAVENARRVALIVAALAHPNVRTVNQNDACFAVSLIRLTLGDMIDRVNDEVATTKAERDKRVILRALRGGAPVPKSDLTRRTQSLSRHEREDSLDDLIDAGRVEEVDGPCAGRKSVTYFRRIW